MATGSSRDVNMTLSVDTLGTESVTKLQEEVKQLGTVGKTVAPEFQQLADEIGKLGEQAAALKTFQQLSADTEELAKNQAQASSTTADLRVKLEALKVAELEAGLVQKAAAAALNEKTVAARANRDASALLALAIKVEGDATQAQVAQQNELKAASISLRAEKERAADELRNSNAALRDASAQTDKLATSYKFAESASNGAAVAFRANVDALAQATATAKVLSVDTDNVAASQARLVQSFNASGNAAKSAFQTQVAESRTLLQAAANVESWRIALERSEAQVKETAAAAAAAGQRIKDAFGTLGVRGVEELQAEIVKVRAAMDTVRSTAASTGSTLNGAFAAGEAKIRALEAEIRKVSGTLTTADRAASLFKNSLGQIAAGNIVADGVGYLVNKVKDLGRAFIDAIVQGDQMRRGLTAIYGDAAIAAQQIDFLRKSSSESGVAFGQLTGEFVKFSASMKSANIPLSQSNELFKALTAASATLGLGTEATAGALNALGQIASKGTVSMEELRQQLGDRLPGALGLTAKGFGITEAQLIKLVESGNLAARDFVGPFTKGLQGMRGEVDGLVPAYDRFKGLLSATAQAIGDAGATVLLTGALKALGAVVGGVAIGISALIEGLFLFGATLTSIAGVIKGDAGAIDFLGQQFEKASDRTKKQIDALAALVAPSEAASSAAEKHTVALQGNTDEVVKAALANINLDIAQKLTAISAALAGDATIDAAAKIVQFNVQTGELLKLQGAQTEAFDKSAKAAKTQGDVLIQLADIRGQDVDKIKAQVDAAALYSAALDKAAASQAAETAILVAQKAELEASNKARGGTTDTIKVQIDALDKLILKSAAETESHRQASEAAKVELAARQLAAEVYKDNALRVGEFTLALTVANETVREYQRLQLNGKVTEEQLAIVKRQAAGAQALLNDALADSIGKLDLESRAKQANASLTRAQVAVEQEHYTTLAAQARASGDYTLALHFEISAKEAQIKGIKLSIQIKNLEAQADLAGIEIKRSQIVVGDALAVQKNKELDILVTLIKVKQTETKLSLEAIGVIEREITAMRQNGATRDQTTSGIGNNSAARVQNTSVINSQTDALRNQREEEEKKRALDNNPSRGRAAIDARGSSILEEKRRTGTLSAADLTLAQAAFDSARINEIQRFNNPSAFSADGNRSITEEQLRATTILEQVKGLVRQSQQTSQQGTPQPNASRTVNVTINGRNTPVNVSSQADSDALTAILRQLEAARGAAP